MHSAFIIGTGTFSFTLIITLHDSLCLALFERKCVRECAALGSWARYKSPMPDTKRGRVNV